MLERHGIVIRGAAAAERVTGGFGALYPVLRALEEAGSAGAATLSRASAPRSSRCRARWTACARWPKRPARQGRTDPWDTGVSARRADERRVVVLAAADPANAYGAALPWPERPGETPGGHRPGRKAGALVVLADGELVLYVERGGKTLLSWTTEPSLLDPAVAALAAAVRTGALGRLTVERADGGAVYDSPLARALETAGFARLRGDSDCAADGASTLLDGYGVGG